MDNPDAPHVETYARAGAAPADVVVALTQQGVVITHDAMTGAPLWRWPTRDPSAHIAGGDGRVYVSAATTDRPLWVEVDPPPSMAAGLASHASPLLRVPRIKVRPSAVTALRAHDGAVLWRVTLYSAASAERLMLAGSALVTSMLSFEHQAREVIALYPATGALRWSQRTGPLPGAYGVLSQPLLWATDDTVALRMDAPDAGDGESGEPSFALVDALTGAMTWQGQQEPPNDAARLRSASDGVIVARDQERARRGVRTFVHAVRGADGAEVWRLPCFEAGVPLPPPDEIRAHTGLAHLLSYTRRVTRVHTVSVTTGRVLWRWRRPRWLAALFALRQALQRIDGARRDRAWRTFWRDALRLRWLHPVRPASGATMDVGHGCVYVATALGVFALRAQDGRRLWHALPFTDVAHLCVCSRASAED